MTRDAAETRDARWQQHSVEWREPAQIVSHWREAERTDRALLTFRVAGEWWDVLEETGITLLVTREYEHLVMAIRGGRRAPQLSYLPLPHPSGLVVDRERGVVHIASTRNPNQVYDLMPATGLHPREDVRLEPLADRPLVQVRSRFLPGSLYLHDLALVGGALHANAVGENAVVRLHADGRVERAWWPRSIETDAGPRFGTNYLQLNSIAAGDDLATSFFSASTERPAARRPGHRNFPVDRRGVIFAGATREPVVRGLTRPHSARLHAGRLWIDNSGYGELGVAEGERFESIARLPGWTRGLCMHGDVAFVGTSRVLPRFRQYAPGLDVAESACGVHAVDTRSGAVLGSLTWPNGNQIFAIDWAPADWTSGFPFPVEGRGSRERIKQLFYAYRVDIPEDSSQ